jgi:hypothetical protein
MQCISTVLVVVCEMSLLLVVVCEMSCSLRVADGKGGAETSSFGNKHSVAR